MSTRRNCVLVVEVAIMISNLIVVVLGDSGFDVTAVANAEDALFTDSNLPGGMDGSTLAARVRERRPELPVVYCSGRYSPSALSPPVTRSVFLKKPYDLADVCTLLTRLTSTAH